MSRPAADIPGTGGRPLDDSEGPDARPIPDRIRAEILDPFIAAVCSTLAQMAQTAAEARAACATATSHSSGDVTVVLDLTPTPGAMLVLDFPGPTAQALADRVLTEAGGAADDALVRDFMGEIANVVAGQAKAMLHGTRHRFAFTYAEDHPARRTPSCSGRARRREFLIVDFASDVGDFTLRVRPAGGEAEGG